MLYVFVWALVCKCHMPDIEMDWRNTIFLYWNGGTFFTAILWCLGWSTGSSNIVRSILRSANIWQISDSQLANCQSFELRDRRNNFNCKAIELFGIMKPAKSDDTQSPINNTQSVYSRIFVRYLRYYKTICR